MSTITKAQIIKFNILLSELGLRDHKESIVYQFSNGRETSTKGLTITEASKMLKYLSAFDPCDKMRRKVFALAYEAGIIYGETPEDKKMNEVKLNQFLNKKGAVKKNINKMNKPELIKTVNLFESILKHNENSKAASITKKMLTELNMQILTK